MAGEHGKNREIDFAYWANLGDKDDLSDEETVRLPRMLDPRRLQTGMNESDALDVALIQCENLYRVAALLAYGNGLAGYCDVERFTLVEGVSPNGATTPNHSDGYDESELLTVTVTMPYAWGYDEGRIPELPITFFSVWCSAVHRCAVPRRVGARVCAQSVRTGRMTAPAPAMPQF